MYKYTISPCMKGQYPARVPAEWNFYKITRNTSTRVIDLIWYSSHQYKLLFVRYFRSMFRSGWWFFLLCTVVYVVRVPRVRVASSASSIFMYLDLFGVYCGRDSFHLARVRKCEARKMGGEWVLGYAVKSKSSFCIEEWNDLVKWKSCVVIPHWIVAFAYVCPLMMWKSGPGAVPRSAKHRNQLPRKSERTKMNPATQKPVFSMYLKYPLFKF